MIPTPGPVLFARFAFPPNVLGHCGPDASGELLERADASTSDPDLRALAAAFEGAWPYLELIAGANGIADPLDARVVEAYWLGGPLLDLPPGPVQRALEERFRPGSASAWSRLAPAVDAGPRPHHDFHVFCVYPWTGLLRSGATDTALHVLDRCRIRWGLVSSIDEAQAIVSSRPLTWDGHRLGVGPLRDEVVSVGDRGYRLDRSIRAGDTVALHWDWACARLGPHQVLRLAREQQRQLAYANGLAVPPPLAVLR